MEYARKIVRLVINSTCVRKAIGIYQRYQTNRARIKDFELNKAQVIDWVLDEATKAANRVHGFELKLGTDKDLRQNLLATIDAVHGFFLKELNSKPNKPNWFIKLVINIASRIVAKKLVKSCLAQTTWLEKGDTMDSVIVYPQHFCDSWREDYSENEVMVRSSVRHEFRHAEQIQALRKAGGEELVKKVTKLEFDLAYNDRLMEKDAISGQFTNAYRPINEFVEEILQIVD